jgi:hypothetical protein
VSHDLLAFLARKGTSATHARNINLIVYTSSAENVMNCTCLHESWSYKNETMNGYFNENSSASSSSLYRKLHMGIVGHFSS